MNRNGFAPIIVLFIVIGVLIVGGIVYYKMQRLSTLLITINPQTPISSSTVANPINTQSAMPSMAPPVISSPPQVSKVSAPTSSILTLPSTSNLTPPSPFVDKYLMAFLACDASTLNCGDPRNHQTYIAQSNDGVDWSLVPTPPIPGSVPDLIRRGDTLYIFSPGTVVRYHFDTGKTDPPLPVVLLKGDGSSELFVDPGVKIDENGKIVLFYLVGQIGSDPAHCAPGVSTCTKVFHSATEVTGSDGTKFTVDPGDRADILLSSPQDTASDPAVFRDPNGYVLYVSRGQSVEAMRSFDLRGSYEDIQTLPGGMLVNNVGGVPDGFYDPASGKYWIYISSGINSLIKRAVSDNLTSPLQESQFVGVLSGDSVGLGNSVMVASPGFAVNQ